MEGSCLAFQGSVTSMENSCARLGNCSKSHVAHLRRGPLCFTLRPNNTQAHKASGGQSISRECSSMHRQGAGAGAGGRRLRWAWFIRSLAMSDISHYTKEFKSTRPTSRTQEVPQRNPPQHPQQNPRQCPQGPKPPHLSFAKSGSRLRHLVAQSAWKTTSQSTCAREPTRWRGAMERRAHIT